MSKELAFNQYYNLISYFDKLQIVGIHLKHLIENAKNDDDLNYLSQRIEEFNLMLADKLILNKISKEIIEMYDELEVSKDDIGIDENIIERIKIQLL
jgi:hypothetical protein